MGKHWKRAIYAVILAISLLLPSVNATNVTLAWDPSPDEGVVGYKLYFSVQDFTQAPPLGASILSIPIESTAVTVPNLLSGVTYYFSVVSIDQEGVESSFSEVLAYTIPEDSGETDDPYYPSPPTEMNIDGIIPRLWLSQTDGQMVLSIQGSIGATFAIQSSTDPTTPDSWVTITNITLTTVAPNANPTPATTLEMAYIPAMETFADPNPPDGLLRIYRIQMPFDYPVLANEVLTAQGFHTRLYSVSMAGADDYIVCYIEEEGAYLEHNTSKNTVKLVACGQAINEIADNVAATLQQTWTSISEFIIAEDGSKIVLDTIVPIIDPPLDPPLLDQLSTDPLQSSTAP